MEQKLKNAKKILIITDTYENQVNGVVRTLDATARCLKQKGFDVQFLTPKDFYGFPWPFYKEVSMALPLYWIASRKIKQYNPDYIHIATEGVVGLMGRLFCKMNKVPYTTSYHTRFPEYLKKMHYIPLTVSYAYLRWFHSHSKKVLVPTLSMKEILDEKNFKNVVVWHRGVDLETFKPYPKSLDSKRPIITYVGRVSVEKNIQAFIDLKTEGTKIIVGDGPICEQLQKENPDIKFFGVKKGEELAKLYSEGDVFVFPSKSDTYGLVLLESLACGVPFAAYPEPGPIDIAKNNPDLASKTCFIGENLQQNVNDALRLGSKSDAIELAKVFSWENCTNKFANYLTGANEI